jgi:hypothetical protein
MIQLTVAEIFHIWYLSSSSIGGRLNLKDLQNMVVYKSLSLTFQHYPISGFWAISLLIFLGHLQFEFVFIGGPLHYKNMYNVIWSSKRKFYIWVESNKWLLYFGHLSISLKSEYDAISGCWYIPLSIFWGRPQLEVVFYWRSSSFKEFVKYNLVI